jgi:probable F420-dependent oxidoreductase
MQIGAVFPGSQLGDVSAVRAYVRGVEDLGYAHLVALDHVLGADPAIHRGWDKPYDVNDVFHEPFVLFGYVAALTSLELVTGVIALPQRQTALVAKQAAQVDLLTNGRLRLGVGVGWNHVEFEALGREFSNRGTRSEEQVALLRRLWTEKSVSHDGPSERVTGVGLAPLPIQRPIPIWFGVKSSARGFQRVGRLGDGWITLMPPGPELDAAKAAVDAAAIAAGRDPDSIGLEVPVSWGAGGLDAVLHHVAQCRRTRATHVSINTMPAGFASVDEHLEALASVADALGIR